MNVETYNFADDGGIPNSQLPVVLYRGVEGAGDAAGCESLFARNGWRGAWRNGIYPFHHFHSTAHEVLGIVSGAVTVVLGGPSGASLDLEQGDVVVLPAGTGHCRLGSAGDLLVVGAYPNGMEWDLRRGNSAEHGEVLENIRAVPLPDTDPVYGRRGPLVERWAVAGAAASADGPR